MSNSPTLPTARTARKGDWIAAPGRPWPKGFVYNVYTNGIAVEWTHPNKPRCFGWVGWHELDAYDVIERRKK